MHINGCKKRAGKNEMYTNGLVDIAKNTKRIVIPGWLLLGSKHTNQHGKITKNGKFKGTFNKKGAKNQSCYCMRVLGVKGRNKNSANRGNRSNNLGGTIMAVDG
jgi:hypothetical protein